MSEKITENAGCRLELIARVETNFVAVRYVFVNRGVNPVFLFNRLYLSVKPPRVFQTDPDRVNVVFEDRRVTVSKQIVPVPANIDVERRNVPCSTLVASGSSFSEALRIPLPLRPVSPYDGARLGPERSKPEMRELWFSLGYAEILEKMVMSVPVVETEQGDAYGLFTAQPEQQKILIVGPLGDVPSCP